MMVVALALCRQSIRMAQVRINAGPAPKPKDRFSSGLSIEVFQDVVWGREVVLEKS